jgi:hypothetical protein
LSLAELRNSRAFVGDHYEDHANLKTLAVPTNITDSESIAAFFDTVKKNTATPTSLSTTPAYSKAIAPALATVSTAIV